MCVFFIYILPIILTIILYIVYVKIVKDKGDIPRVLRWVLFLVVLVPILGFIACLVYWGVFIYLVLDEGIEIKKDSRLVKYLFKS